MPKKPTPTQSKPQKTRRSIGRESQKSLVAEYQSYFVSGMKIRKFTIEKDSPLIGLYKRMAKCAETFYLCENCRVLCCGIRHKKFHNHGDLQTLSKVLGRKIWCRPIHSKIRFLDSFQKIHALTGEENEILMYPIDQQAMCNTADPKSDIEYIQQLDPYKKLEQKFELMENSKEKYKKLFNLAMEKCLLFETEA
jgi:hypothetical protein